ncbi:MAG TPA: CPXCG motif-containing cysteine-rich protein [Burkholderiales bacterium]|nr:CPXCG motif-containing cysteine-rich protein [Burkholderiales bacterium]
MLDQCTIRCPWCGEHFQALADASEGDAEYVEDCPVCCHPITMRQRVDETGRPSLLADRTD